MIDYIKNITLFLVASILLNGISLILKSTFISSFIDDNLVLIIIALMAINTTTISIIMTKLREITDEFGGNFNTTTRELKRSIVEQIWLIGISVVIFILKSSPIIGKHLPYHDFIFQVFIVTIFCYTLYILYDTATAIFVILNFEDDDNRQNRKNKTP